MAAQKELLERMARNVDELEADVDELTDIMEVVASRTGGGGGGKPIEVGETTVPILLDTDIPANTLEDDPKIKTRSVPFDGKITAIGVGWPDGTQRKAGLSLLQRGVGGNRKEKLVPYNEEDGYWAVNDFSTIFETRIDVESGDKLVGRFVNLDSEEHFVNLFVLYGEE